MTGSRTPVLWITGPAGAGKSTVSWQLFAELAQAGRRVAFADADQLCMCYPAPPGDPGRERLKALNFAAMLPQYRAAGAQFVIANGVLDPAAGLADDVLPGGLLPQAAMTVCRLRADRDELTRRFAGRHGSGPDLEEAIRETLREADALDRSDFADVCVDTTALPVAEVTVRIRETCSRWPGFGDPAGGSEAVSRAPASPVPASPVPGPAGDRPPATAAGAPGHVLLICGPTGVGKSAVGFQAYLRALSAGVMGAYVDLDQIGFVSPAPAGDPGRHQLKAANLAAMWRNYRAAGARHLTVTGPVRTRQELSVYTSALPGATVTLCRLTAGRAELTRRIMSRPAVAAGLSRATRCAAGRYLRDIAATAARESEALDQAALPGVRIDTDGLSIAAAAGAVSAATRWPRIG